MEAVLHAKETATVDLGDLLDAGEDAVVTLVAGDTRLVAHRTVLSDRSPVFGAMFRHDTPEARSGQVIIAEVEGPVLRQLLSYLYTLRAPQLPGMATQLLAAADKYGVSGLKVACEQQVASQLSVETAAAAAVLAVRHSCESLRKDAINFIQANMHVMATQGWAEAVRLHPEEVVEVSRLIVDLPADTSAPAHADSGSSTPCRKRHCRTLASAALATGASHHTPPPDDATVSHLSTPAPAHSGTSHQPHSGDSRHSGASHQPHSGDNRHSGTPASAAPASRPPDDAAVSRLRSLPVEEKLLRLREVARKGAVREIEALLAAGLDVAASVGGMWTALHWAAREGHVEAVRWLLARGAPLEARTGALWTPLHAAAIWGHAAVVRLLLAASADHGARDLHGWTPLHWAASRGNAEAATALLEAGADRAATYERTALDLAREKKTPSAGRVADENLAAWQPPHHCLL